MVLAKQSGNVEIRGFGDNATVSDAEAEDPSGNESNEKIADRCRREQRPLDRRIRTMEQDFLEARRNLTIVM